MKIEPLKPEYSKVLKRIQDSVPQELTSKLMKKETVAPTIRLAYEMMLKDPNASEETKRKAQILLDSGYLDKVVDVVDTEVEKAINQFIEDEIEAAMKRGELPKKKKYRNVGKKIKRIIKTKYERRNTKETN